MNQEYYKKFENALNQRLEEQITAAIETAAVRDAIFSVYPASCNSSSQTSGAHTRKWEEILKGSLLYSYREVKC